MKNRKKLTLKSIFHDWRLYVLLLPSLVYLFIFAYIPMYGVQIAFRDFSPRKGIWGSEWVGLEYFKRFIEYPNFKFLMMNTLRIGLYSLATFPCSIIFALMLNEVRSTKFKKSVQMISYIPHFLSTVVVCSMVTLFFNQKTGVVNAIIEFLGGTRTDFLTKASYFEDIYVWSGVWQGLGFGAIIYIAALASVPMEQIEAARIDGATRLQIIWHVNIPYILPTIIIMLIFSCGGILGVGFEKILLLQNDLNLSRSQVISTYVYEIGIRGGQFSYSSAIGLFNTIINVTILAIVNEIARRFGETSIW
ncbi:sugar ABC transporter permease [uncultured Acetatifactor sp.]|mgnify:CR=1 FL=1|uniref:ABC transporter permease n=1 Tax=uncultured Acetatifactor sp. TaxID=1671927 RepID=UPI0025EDF4EA|nr:ABC transporter permease subunit [uncultured Acetatifactor sp.]